MDCVTPQNPGVLFLFIFSFFFITIQVCRDRESLSCNNLLSQHQTVCRDIELFSLDDLLSRQRTSYRDLGTPCQDPILLRHKTHCRDTVTIENRALSSFVGERAPQSWPVLLDSKALVVAIPYRDIESSYIQHLLSRHRKNLSRHGFGLNFLNSYSLS